MPCPYKIVDQRADRICEQQHSAPVHFGERRMRFQWEELEDPKDKEEDESDTVDPYARLAKLENRIWQGIAEEPFIQYTYLLWAST